MQKSFCIIIVIEREKLKIHLNLMTFIKYKKLSSE